MRRLGGVAGRDRAPDAAATSIPQPTPSTTCPTSGIPLADAPRGCAGDGRIAGGVGAVLSFWPIKAYRPCPKAEAAGKAYTRKGQITDEMLFGGKGKK